MKNPRRIFSFAPTLLVIAVSASQAQVSITSLGAPVTQNFNSLGTNDFLLTNNTSLTGVYLFCELCNEVPNTCQEDPGSSNNGEFKNYGSSGASDRALGSIARDGTGTLYYGVRYANNTGSTISSIEVRYTGEQWRRDNASPHVLSFSYRQAATVTSLTTGTFTPVPALNFTTPQTGGSLQLNGNLAANRTVLSSSFPVTVPNGEEIMLRWTDVNDSGNNHGFGIDDLSVTARAASTASRVTISGRAVTSNGWGIGRAIVTLSGGNLSVPLYSVSNQFGYYRFSDIPVGQSYVVFITSKTYRFSQASRFVNLSQEATDINFTGER